MKGTLCISLDFEKFWGIHDVSNIKSVLSKLEKVPSIVDRLLKLFEKHEVHVTWAVVGMLNFETQKEFINYLNKQDVIPYHNLKFSPIPVNKFNLKASQQNSFLAKQEIDKIKLSKNQELASHTFSHYYCLEDGVSRIDFEKDMQQFKNNVYSDVKSIVFPRNQIDNECLTICCNHKLMAYRGNQNNKFWKNTSFTNESLIQKVGRTLDAYIKISKDCLIDWSSLNNKQNGLVNIPASRFFKPYKFPKFIEGFKIKRIKGQMLNSAKQNKIYHLWWHPHNFSIKTDQNFHQLEELLVYFNELKKEYNYQSLNMNEIAQKVE